MQRARETRRKLIRSKPGTRREIEEEIEVEIERQKRDRDRKTNKKTNQYQLKRADRTSYTTKHTKKRNVNSGVTYPKKRGSVGWGR